MACVVGKGCRSLGFGSFGIRSSGSTFICNKQTRINCEAATLVHKLQRKTMFISLLNRRKKSGSTYPHLALPGTEVEVEAPLEALVDELRVRGHFAQT